jgi:hypothetical protein
MANPGTKRELLVQALGAYTASNGSQRAAAQALGWDRATFARRLKLAQAQGLDKELDIPALPSGEIAVEEKIEYLAKRHAKKLTAKKARTWFKIKVKTNEPIGVCFVGDPHVDSGGCNWTQLKADADIMANTPGFYAINLGDNTDNWVGRLSRLYAHNPTTRSDAIDLAEWLISKSGIKWMALIRGNHDMWTESRKDDPLHWFKRQAPMVDWHLQTELVFPNKTTTRISAAHHFKGASYINPLHGAQRRERETNEADIYASGHTHEWAVSVIENPYNHKIVTYLKGRGYKDIDTYADVGGFGTQENGATVTTIIDPTAEGSARYQTFPDLGSAADYLTFLRQRK